LGHGHTRGRGGGAGGPGKGHGGLHAAAVEGFHFGWLGVRTGRAPLLLGSRR
jgi:hypothetical protein